MYLAHGRQFLDIGDRRAVCCVKPALAQNITTAIDDKGV